MLDERPARHYARDRAVPGRCAPDDPRRRCRAGLRAADRLGGGGHRLGSADLVEERERARAAIEQSGQSSRMVLYYLLAQLHMRCAS